MAITQLKDGRWICYYRVKGEGGKSKIKKEYFGRGAGARVTAQKRNEELKLKPRRSRKVTQGPAFEELASEYIQNKNFSANSKKHLLIRLNANILPVFGNTPAIRITDRDLDDYVKKRLNSHVAAITGSKENQKRKIVKDKKGKPRKVGRSTVRREITDIKAILNWAVKRRPSLIPHNPVRDYKSPESDDAIIPPPTQEETSAILKAASPHLIRAILLSYYLGLRPGSVELLTLTWDNVSWDTKTILVESAHKGGSSKRSVPIHDDFFDLLKQWYSEDKKRGYIVHYRGKPIKKIQTSWEGALKRAGITRRIRPYDIRHNFITQALADGADLKALSEIVGSRPETLMRHYQHVTRELHRQTVAKIPSLNLQNKKSED
jgi:integrase